MKIGIGIPNSIPGSEGRLLLDWARRADALGFSALSTIGRVAYPTYEELVTLAAAAGATERIGLLTGVLLTPTRDPVLLAKAAASLDQLSGGRFVLGMGVGGRGDDFEATGRSMSDRGKRFDRDLELMHRAWRGEPVAGSPRPVTPAPVNGDSVPVLIGGQAPQAMQRAARWGIGWMSGGGGPQWAAGSFDQVRAAWREAGRQGKPELKALQYVALGPRAQSGRDYLEDYYGEFVERIWPTVPLDADGVREAVRAFEEIGTTELFFSPTIASLEQVELLAEAALSPAGQV
jgi:alkanesulfonate monooxygenase SsuD/methylene tetrahydromethanopterin reductase-like flavin-dependent oxidoreductase (luciferase family)